MISCKYDLVAIIMIVTIQSGKTHATSIGSVDFILAIVQFTMP